MKLTLTPVEQRYVASCYPLPDRPFMKEAMRWKEKLRSTAMEGKDLSVSAGEIGLAFPHIGALCAKGVFTRMSMLQYFEGHGEDSHDFRMYLFAKRIARKGPSAVLQGVLEHIDACSVRIARADGSLWTYGGMRSARLDEGYFGVTPASGYAFVHGRSENGYIVIRGASEAECSGLISWFEERWRSRENPFTGLEGAACPAGST